MHPDWHRNEQGIKTLPVFPLRKRQYYQLAYMIKVREHHLK